MLRAVTVVVGFSIMVLNSIFAQTSPCYNIDFETGTLNGWNTAGDVTITTSANTDPYGGFPQAIGNYSVMISNDVCNSSLFGQISRQILITPNNAVLKMHLALVIYNDESHDSLDAAMFFLKFLDSAGNELTCPKFSAYYDGSIDSFIGFPDSIVQYTPNATYYDCAGLGPNNISYIPWYTVWIDLSSYIGQTITIVARVEWCAYDVDWAYAYLDFECVNTSYNMSAACDTLPQELCGPPQMLWYEWYDSLNNLLSTNRCDTFYTKGIYTVKFAHPDYCSGNDIVSELKIPIGFSPPAARLKVDTVCFGDTSTLIVIIDSSESPISHIVWDFGDGTIDTTLYPDSITSHYYNNIGPYNLTIIVQDTIGCVDSVIVDSFALYKLFEVDLLGDSFVCSYDTATLIALTFDSFPTHSFTYIWNFGDGTIDTTYDSIIVHYYDSVGNFNAIIQVYRQGCMDLDSHLITIVPPPQLQTATTAPVCEDSFFTLSVHGAFSYEWIFPDSTLSTDSIITISPASVNDAGLYIVKGVNIHGCISYDTVKVVVWKRPQIHISLDTVCLGDTTTLIVHIDSALQKIIQYLWHTGDGTTYINNYPDSVFEHNYNIEGAYAISVTVIDSVQCKTTLHDTALVFLPFTSEIITDSAYCLNDTSQLIAITYDTLSSSLVYIWDMGDGNIDTTFDSIIAYVYGDTGTYEIILHVAFDNCKSRAVDTITIHPLPSTTAHSSPVCEDSTLILRGTGANYYNWFFNGSQIASDSIVLISPATLSHNGIYILKGTNIYGCITYDTVEAVVWERPTVTTMDTSICYGDTIVINTSVTGGTPPYIYKWTPTTNISCTSCVEPSVAPPSTTNYVIKVVDQNKCYRYDTATITVLPLPVIDIEDAAFCYYDTLVINADRQDLVKWLWTPSELVSCDTCPIVSIRYSPNIATNHTLSLWVQDTNTCQWIDTFKVYIDTGIAVQLLKDTIVYTGEEVILNVVANSWNYYYNWETTLPALFLTQNEGIFQPVTVDTYQVVYLSETNIGCLRADTAVVIAIEPPTCNKDIVFVPNAFTPNGDGINDVLYVYSVAPVIVNTWRVYDQWGNLLFEANNQQLGLPLLRSQKGWDGTHEGKKLPPDVYVFYLEYTCDNKTYFMKGDVSILY